MALDWPFDDGRVQTANVALNASTVSPNIMGDSIFMFTSKCLRHFRLNETADMALGEHLRVAKKKGLGEEFARFGRRDAQYKRFSQTCSCLCRFPARHTPSPAARCDLSTARDPTRTQQPQYDIPQMTEEEPVYESMHGGCSYH